jgi:hypothetical protein
MIAWLISDRYAAAKASRSFSSWSFGRLVAISSWVRQ